MKSHNKPPQKEKQKSTGLFYIFEILSETALVLLSRLKGWSELRPCSPMQPKEGSADEIPDCK